jgi:hypothetical protein
MPFHLSETAAEIRNLVTEFVTLVDFGYPV